MGRVRVCISDEGLLIANPGGFIEGVSVKNLLTGKIEVTSQNHSYAVEQESLANTPLEVTHINLLDNTIEGVQCEKDSVFCVQYHPESAPGPQDSAYLFDRFLENMKQWKEEKHNA